MGRKHCGKRRNCSYEQFLLFPQRFQKSSKQGLVWERLLWRDQQNAVAEEKRSPNATKEHHIKESDSIYYTLTPHYFQHYPMLLVLI